MLRPPESNATGAVPQYAAKRSRLSNRATSRVCPMIMAATIGPIPKMSVSEVPDAVTASSTRRREARSCVSR